LLPDIDIFKKENAMNVIQRAFMKSAFKGFRPMMQNFYAMWGELCKAFYKKFGKEAIPIITEISGKSGVVQAELTQQMMPVKDMKDIGELYKMMDSMMEIGMEIVELTDDTIHFKVPRCVVGIEGTSKELCEAMMTSDAEMASTLLGQEIEMQILKSIAVGDNECDVVFSIKNKKREPL
jgi:predicted hydrocarbon binding protein